MTTAEKVFILIILVNTLIAVAYFIWGCLVQSVRAEGKTSGKPKSADTKGAREKRIAGKREPGRRTAEKKDGGKKGAGKKDGGKKGTGEKDDWNRGTGERDDWNRGTGEKDDWSREPGERDDWSREPGEKDDWNRGTGEKDDWGREPGEKDGWSRGTGEKDDWNRESGERDDRNRGTGERDDRNRGTGEKDDWNPGAGKQKSGNPGKGKAETKAGDAKPDGEEDEDGEVPDQPEWKMLSRTGYFFKALVMLLCPVAGVLFFVTTQLMYTLFFRTKADLTDVIFGKEKVVASRKADEENERNRVPIEEALAVADKESLRALVMDVVKGDVKKSLATISLALNSEDTETSHYAASVLRDALNDFRQESQELYNALHRGDDRAPEYACMMIEYMNEVLSQEVFPEIEQRSYVEMMEEACTWLYHSEEHRYRLHCEYIEWICTLLLRLKEYGRMETWCSRCMEIYPEELTSYTVQLKLYFSTQNREKFFAVMDRLKQSDIVIDRDTLDLIRVFS